MADRKRRQSQTLGHVGLKRSRPAIASEHIPLSYIYCSPGQFETGRFLLTSLWFSGRKLRNQKLILPVRVASLELVALRLMSYDLPHHLGVCHIIALPVLKSINDKGSSAIRLGTVDGISGVELLRFVGQVMFIPRSCWLKYVELLNSRK